MGQRIFGIGIWPLAALVLCTPAEAAEPSAAEMGFILNNLFVLVCGVLVMFMAAGFAMLEAGTVRSKSVATICAKNIALYAIAGIAFFLTGYQLMYGDSLAGLIGGFGPWQADDSAAMSGDFESGLAASTDWFFQMVFVATAASVVSGALAERIRFWPFAIFSAALAAVIYPTVGHWTWGGGWLSQMGFHDFAGSTIVHAVGGWAALVGIILVGPRKGRFGRDGSARTMAPSSLPMVTLGTFILWMGWFGFNGGSQLSLSSAEDAIAVGTIFVNTNMAAAGGVVTMLIACHRLQRRLDLPLILNGALAGLVGITADPVSPNVFQALMIGSIASLVMMSASRLLERWQLDDVVGAVPVHLAAGAWGTLAVALTNPEADILVQAAGVGAVGGFVVVASLAIWGGMRAVVRLRLAQHDEGAGSDLTEVGLRAYNLW